jgi:hypothetical protein
VVVLPAIDAFQRPSSQRLLHYWPPSSFYLFPVTVLRAAYRCVPSGFVQRTGCSACGLGYPHQVLVSSAHVHRSLLVPVSFASFLIKCLRVYWQSLPQCRFAWPFSRRVGFSSRCFSRLSLIPFFVCRAFAVRHGYPSPVIFMEWAPSRRVGVASKGQLGS